MGVVNVAEVACVDQVYDISTQALYDGPIGSMYYHIPLPLASKLVNGLFIQPMLIGFIWTGPLSLTLEGKKGTLAHIPDRAYVKYCG